MKREILFRGKSTRFNSWQYGLPYSSGYDGIIDQIVIGEYHEDVYPETVSQFTGLTDKNGVKIFEGDVLDNNEIVTYSNGCFMTLIGALVLSANHREIIGNIHE